MSQVNEKSKKIDREFLLTDSSLNSYSFRLLTGGLLLDEVKKNPIGYRMHARDEGIVVRWEDFRLEGDKLFAKPVINLSNSNGSQTVDEVENHFLNAASVGHIIVKEISNNPKDYLPDQQGPTVSKWFYRECSLVDIPGNYNALADLFDENDNKINLADFKHQKNNMEKIFLTPEQLVKIGLKADSKQEEVNTAIADLVAKAAKVDSLQTELTAANQKVTDKETEIANLKSSQAKEKVTAMLEAAVNEKKITVELKAKFEKQYEGRPDELKEILDAMKPYQPITAELNAKQKADEAISKMSWAELDKAGKLEDLKASNLELFKQKYKEQFGKEYEKK